MTMCFRSCGRAITQPCLRRSRTPAAFPRRCGVTWPQWRSVTRPPTTPRLASTSAGRTRRRRCRKTSRSAATRCATSATGRIRTSRPRSTGAPAVVAPSFDEAALDAMTSRPKLRVLQPGQGPAQLDLDARPITGGFLVQTADQTGGTLGESRVVTATVPDELTYKDLQFALTVVKHVRSNAIVLAHEGAAVGIGAGQMSRVEAVELAVHRAGPRAAGSVLASDGFFPYPDGVEVAARAGVRAIVQPGGSVKDGEAIAAADTAGLAMVFTGERHFKH